MFAIHRRLEYWEGVGGGGGGGGARFRILGGGGGGTKFPAGT